MTEATQRPTQLKPRRLGGWMILPAVSVFVFAIGLAATEASEIGIRLAQQAVTAPAGPGKPFTFTVPQSRVIVKVSDAALRPDSSAPQKSNYFKLSKSEPALIVSGWLEPAARYPGLKAFWDAESRSPALTGRFKPVRVEMLKAGAWEIVAYDIALPEDITSAHLRAERVQAGTWIDLHLSTIAAKKAPAALRAELLAALARIDVINK